ncbi:uncharacterized protein CLUP02_14648 [Colletotrichum lupini]|uniref:Uncharacterized protein n=1 Tax=Colletotrichum lupini TaxID=145971 RepID=A0A9Q8WNH7_9PEZI|nr:uncharacterized protein CLUP02_14648 [Colletotrichum lupini]UQC89120.1 hypothetical protein CLUP02_14648 [Colletotrichum lupini]
MGQPSFAASNALIYVTYGLFLITGTAIAWKFRNQSKGEFLSGNRTQTETVNKLDSRSDPPMYSKLTRTPRSLPLGPQLHRLCKASSRKKSGRTAQKTAKTTRLLSHEPHSTMQAYNR